MPPGARHLLVLEAAGRTVHKAVGPMVHAALGPMVHGSTDPSIREVTDHLVRKTVAPRGHEARGQEKHLVATIRAGAFPIHARQAKQKQDLTPAIPAIAAAAHHPLAR